MRKLSFCEYFLNGVVFFCAAVTITGCAAGKSPTVCLYEEEAAIDSFQEVQIGRAMAEEVIKKVCPPCRDPVKQLYVNKIGQKLARVCGRQDIIYHFMILDSPDLNTFALPGGYIFIYRGLFERLDEDELLAILAHEIGHVVSRDAVKKMQSDLGYPVMAGLVLFALGERDPQLEEELPRLRELVFEALSKGYDREEEFLADSLAVKYLKASGGDPSVLARVLELLEKEAGPGGRIFETLSSPSVMRQRVLKIRERASVS